MERFDGNVIPFVQDDGSFYLLLVSPPPLVERILDLAELQVGETPYDLGSGDGRLIIRAAEERGAKAVGIELNPELYEISRQAVAERGLQNRVDVQNADLYRSDLDGANVVTLYLDHGDVTEGLRERLADRLRDGARIISVDQGIPAWRPAKVERAIACDQEYTVYLYSAGALAADGQREVGRVTGVESTVMIM
jgi:SAM-dependent methyltransferase